MAADDRLTKEPWSAPVKTGEIGRGVTRRLVADEATRARVAKALDLNSLDRLEAEVTVAPEGDDWEVRGRINASLAQTCGITLEPLPAEIATSFEVRCRETEDDRGDDDREVVVDFDETDPPDLIENGSIDLARYVVEHLALELDPFPLKPGAVFEAPETAPEPSPFAALARLKPETKA